MDNFSSLIVEQFSDNTKGIDFPLDVFINTLNASKKRNTDLFETNFIDYHWLSLKVLMPARIFQFEPDTKGRFNPEIDHIFPVNLDNQNQDYKEFVDILWNMQPVKGDINNYKRKKHPKVFFSSDDGKKYIGEYDFLPTQDLNNQLWHDYISFINERKILMITFLKNEYEIDLKN